MKRSPIKRKTRLARKTPLRRRTRIRTCTADRRRWLKEYDRALTHRKHTQAMATGATYCERCGIIGRVEGHHTQGRARENILVFKLVCRGCHQFIHEHAREARKEGWLK